MPYCGQRFWIRQIPTSCLPTQLVFIHIEHICTFFVAFFSATIDDTNLIFGHKLHIGTPYRGKRFWIHQIPTSCLPTLLIFLHIEHICSFFVAFFSATIDGRILIFGHQLHIGTPYRGKHFLTSQIPTSCLPKGGGIIREHQLTVHLVKWQYYPSLMVVTFLYILSSSLDIFVSLFTLNIYLQVKHIIIVGDI